VALISVYISLIFSLGSHQTWEQRADYYCLGRRGALTLDTVSGEGWQRAADLKEEYLSIRYSYYYGIVCEQLAVVVIAYDVGHLTIRIITEDNSLYAIYRGFKWHI
jgi:hypothetical protein